MAATTPGGFTIEESARRLGNFRWIEMRLFELLGGWVALTPEPEIKVWLADESRHHGWHSELLEERLPEVRDLSPERQTVAPDAAFAALVEALGTVDGDRATIGRLTALTHVVLPHLTDAYRAHLERCTPVADRAVTRTLGFIVADLTAEALTAGALLDSIVRDDDDAAVLVERRAAFEALLAASAGISGP